MGNRAVGFCQNRVIDMNIREALDMPQRFNEELYNVARILAGWTFSAVSDKENAALGI